MTARGTFLLTFDVELLWGLFFDERWRKRALARYGDIREAFGEILRILARHDVRATFAFVGHLFLDRCESANGRPHPEMPRPKDSPIEGDWYRYDPGTDLARDPLWYGRDLVTAVKAARPAHEIGVHGFSHAFLDDHRELARAELAAARDAAAALGIAPRSFVYPRNRVGFPDELAAAGFACYRDAWSAPPRIRGLFARFAGAAPPVGRARRENGLVVAPAGHPLLAATGFRRLVPLRSRLREFRRGLARARDEGAVLHYWTHPHNFMDARAFMLKTFDRAMGLVAAARERGEIEVRTMGDLVP